MKLNQLDHVVFISGSWQSC